MFYEVEWFKEEVDEFWKEWMNKFLWKKKNDWKSGWEKMTE